MGRIWDGVLFGDCAPIREGSLNEGKWLIWDGACDEDLVLIRDGEFECWRDLALIWGGALTGGSSYYIRSSIERRTKTKYLFEIL